jgi:hypothetical protein
MELQSVDAMEVLRFLAAKYALGLARSWELPPAADRALDAGIYSESLAEVASTCDPIMSDVGPLFERAMTELGERIPEQLEAAWILTRFCVEQIAQPTSSPVEVLHFLCWEVDHHHSVPEPKDVVGEALDISELLGIYHSYSEPNENYYEPEQRLILDERERQSLLDRLARAEARAWLERHPTPE